MSTDRRRKRKTTSRPSSPNHPLHLWPSYTWSSKIFFFFKLSFPDRWYHPKCPITILFYQLFKSQTLKADQPLATSSSFYGVGTNQLPIHLMFFVSILQTSLYKCTRHSGTLKSALIQLIQLKTKQNGLKLLKMPHISTTRTPEKCFRCFANNCPSLGYNKNIIWNNKNNND